MPSALALCITRDPGALKATVTPLTKWSECHLFEDRGHVLFVSDSSSRPGPRKGSFNGWIKASKLRHWELAQSVSVFRVNIKARIQCPSTHIQTQCRGAQLGNAGERGRMNPGVCWLASHADTVQYFSNSGGHSWRADSEVKNTCNSYGEPRFSSHYPYLQFQEIWPLLTSTGARQAHCTTHTCRQNTYTHKIK